MLDTTDKNMTVKLFSKVLLGVKQDTSECKYLKVYGLIRLESLSGKKDI